MNDEERRLWVLNDESLYLAQRASGETVQGFIKKNRKDLDAAIERRLGRQPGDRS